MSSSPEDWIGRACRWGSKSRSWHARPGRGGGGMARSSRERRPYRFDCSGDSGFYTAVSHSMDHVETNRLRVSDTRPNRVTLQNGQPNMS
jgi:hypothetical protein